MILPQFFISLLMILVGRKLYWLVVGVVGFLIGIKYAGLLQLPPQTVPELAVAIVLGLAGAILAICFQWLTVMYMVGFLGGGYVASGLFAAAAAEQGGLIFIAGGLVGVILVLITYDWALIILTSLLGATLLIESLPSLGTQWQLPVMAGALLAGICVQFMSLKSSQMHDEKGVNT